jgi:phosphoadenosine phosphosulfate reductase
MSKDKVVFSTSFGQEGPSDNSFNTNNNQRYTLDTGRLFQETYDVFIETIKSIKITRLFPETTDVQNLLNQRTSFMNL